MNPPEFLKRDISLAPLTTLDVGGEAEYFGELRDPAMAVAAVSWAKKNGLKCRILGGGSNVVVADRGLTGVTLKLVSKGWAVRRRRHDAVDITVSAGENWHKFVS